MSVDNDVLSRQNNITKEELVKIIPQSRRKSYVCQHIWQQFFLPFLVPSYLPTQKDNNLFEPYLQVNWGSCLMLVLSQFLSRVVFYGMSDLSSLQINHSLVELALSMANRVFLH